MSKRDNRAAHHRAAPPVTGPQEARARVESLIASGKTREALDLAKQWFKETRSAEAEALVIAAYEARIGAMLAQGLYADATALAALVGDRFPAHRQRIVPLVTQSKAIAAGDVRTLVAELAAAAPPRRPGAARARAAPSDRRARGAGPASARGRRLDQGRQRGAAHAPASPAAPCPRARREGSGDCGRHRRAHPAPARARAAAGQADLHDHGHHALVSAEPESQAPDRGPAPGPARPRLAARDAAADRPHARA